MQMVNMIIEGQGANINNKQKLIAAFTDLMSKNQVSLSMEKKNMEAFRKNMQNFLINVKSFLLIK